jgi:hypothetical protein
MTTVIYSDLVPLRERGKYQGYGNIAYAVRMHFLLLLLLLKERKRERGGGGREKKMCNLITLYICFLSLVPSLVPHWEVLLLTILDGVTAFISTCLS